MLVNDINSQRKLTIFGHGWILGEISLEFIGRHSCSSAILDEEDFEYEEGELRLNNKYLSFSNSMQIILRNLDNKKENIYDFKNLKRLKIYKGELDPEDLILTNSFENTHKIKSINHHNYEDEDYYLEFQQSWIGVYGEFIFEIGEIFDYKRLNIIVEKLNTGNEFYEWVCNIEYEKKKKRDGNIKVIKINKTLRVR